MIPVLYAADSMSINVEVVGHENGPTDSITD